MTADTETDIPKMPTDCTPEEMAAAIALAAKDPDEKPGPEPPAECFFKLGLNPSEPDDRTLQFADYLHPVQQMPEPPACDYNSNVIANGGYPMDGNDAVGDCTCAGMAHAEQVIAMGAYGLKHQFTADETLAVYSAITGYVPGDESTDHGADLLSCVKYWQANGFSGDKPLHAFVEVDPANIDHIKQALNMFGPLYVAYQLPDDVLPQGPGSIPDWTTDGQPNPSNGHCVIYSAYDPDGLTVVTWGQTVKASWDFHSRCCVQVFALLHPAWMDHNPQGFDVSALEQDLEVVQGRVGTAAE